MDTAIKPIVATTSLSILFHSSVFAAALLLYGQVTTQSEGAGSGIEIELVSSLAVAEQKENSRLRTRNLLSETAVEVAHEAEPEAISEAISEAKHETGEKPAAREVLTSAVSLESIPLPEIADREQRDSTIAVIKKMTDKNHNTAQVLQATSASQQQHSIIELLHSRISDNKIYPYLAQRQRRQGVSKVAFVLHPDGSVENTRLVRTSQSGALDRAALSAVNRIQPFTAAQDYIDHAREFQIDVVFNLL